MTEKYTYRGYTIELNKKPYVTGCDWDAYKPGDEENGFTAPTREAAIDLIDDEIERDNEEKIARFLRSPVKKAQPQQHTIQDGFKTAQIERDYQRGLYNPHHDTLLNRSTP